MLHNMAYGKKRSRYVARRRSKRRSTRRRLGSTSGSRKSTMSRYVSPEFLGPVSRYVSGTVDKVQKIRRAAIPMLRRKGGPAVTVTKMDEDNNDTGGYSQWRQYYKQARFGQLTRSKIDKISIERMIFTHRNLGPFNDYGKVYMKNYQDAGGNVTYPLMMFELNSAPQYIGGTLTACNPVYTMYQTAANQIAWSPETGLLPDGTTTSANWQLENSPHVTSSHASVPGDNAIHKWSSLDLELWGAKNKGTKYHIALVQFSEDVLPDWGTRTGQSAEFWQALVKHYTYSPLAKMETGWGKNKMKILKQYTYNIDPTSTTENDPDPHVKTLKLFYRFNRMSNFQWMYATPNVLSTADMDQADWRNEQGNLQNQVHPNARIYVMVRASNFTKVTAPTAVDNTTSPSISWRLRTAWMAQN